MEAYRTWLNVVGQAHVAFKVDHNRWHSSDVVLGLPVLLLTGLAEALQRHVELRPVSTRMRWTTLLTWALGRAVRLFSEANP